GLAELVGRPHEQQHRCDEPHVGVLLGASTFREIVVPVNLKSSFSHRLTLIAERCARLAATSSISCKSKHYAFYGMVETEVIESKATKGRTRESLAADFPTT